MSERVVAMAAFLAGGLVMALALLLAEPPSWLAGWWVGRVERRLDREFHRVLDRRDLDVLHEHLLIEEGCWYGPANFLVEEPWDSSGWLDDAPRESGGQR